LEVPAEILPLLDQHGCGAKLLLLFDYEWTLAPFMDQQEVLILPHRTRTILGCLAKSPHTAVGVISNRNITSLKEALHHPELYYCASGGLEFDLSGMALKNPQAERVSAKFAVLASRVEQELKDIGGAYVEKHFLGFTVHCRMADMDLISEMRELTVKGLDGFLQEVFIRQGSQGIEVEPRMEWAKSGAIKAIAEASGTRPSEVLFFSDAATGGEALRAAREFGGFAISVGASGPGMKDLHLPSPASMMRLLEEIFVPLCRERSLAR
jgi:trehalose-phosphatase